MRTQQLQPQTFIQRVLADAESAINKANKGNEILSKTDIGRLPSQLQGVVDDFKAAGHAKVKTNELLGALKSSLEAGLKRSLQAGDFVAGELTGDLASLVSFSQTGLQVAQLLEARASKAPESFADAAAEAQAALAQANPSVTAQVSAFKALRQAADVAKIDAPDTAQLLGGIVKDRAKLMRKVVDQTVKFAEQAVKADGSVANKQSLASALQAAVDVTQALNPKSSKLKSLAKKQSALGIDAPSAQSAKQPFFARFLEQQSRGEGVETLNRGESPDAVTLKYPSDAEDGGDSGGVGDITTEKYPSDAEDGGDAGDTGGIFTTLKYPSDNEDGGDDGAGMNVTLKFPSDAEDGGGSPGDLVTLKFPSDAEDGGGGAELIPELRPEIQPELIPEIAPEIRPEIIVEIAPELRPGGSSNANKAERTAVKAAWHGYGQLEHELNNIDDLMRRARLTPDKHEELTLASTAMKALLHGGPGVQNRIDEINKLFRTALIDEPGTKKLQAELGMLSSLNGIVGEHKRVADQRERQRDARPEKPIEIRAHRLAFEGQGAVDKRMGELKSRLELTDLPAHKRTHASVEYNALKALSNGGQQIEQRLKDIQNLEMRALMTPEMSQELNMEKSVLRSLLGVTQGYEKRMNELDNGPGPLPPQPPPPELIVELRPEIRPEIIVEIAPETAPATFTGKAERTRDGSWAVRVGGESLEIIANTPAAKAGVRRLDQSPGLAIQDLEVAGTRGTLQDPSGGPDRQVIFATNVTVKRVVIPPQPPPPEVIVELRPEIQPELIPEIAPEIRPEIIVEIAPELRPQTGLAREVERAVVKAAYHGMETVLEKAEEKENLLQTARMSPELYLRTSVEAQALRATYGGAKELDKQIASIEHQLTRRGPMTPQRRTELTTTLEVLQNVSSQLDTYKSTADAILRRRHQTPAEGMFAKHLLTAHEGGQAMLDRVIELSNQPAAIRGQVDYNGIGVATMKTFYEGGPALEKAIKQMEAQQFNLGGTPDIIEAFTVKLELLRMLFGAIGTFEKRMEMLDGNGPQIAINPIPDPTPAINPIPDPSGRTGGGGDDDVN